MEIKPVNPMAEEQDDDEESKASTFWKDAGSYFDKMVSPLIDKQKKEEEEKARQAGQVSIGDALKAELNDQNKDKV